MSTTTSTDPIQTVLDVLDASPAASWSNENGKPERLARSGEYSPSKKTAYESDALYAYRVDAGAIEQLDGSGDSRIERPRVAIEVWTLSTETVARALGEDMRSVLRTYWTDNSTETVWTTVRPVNERNLGHETWDDETTARHNTRLVTVELMRSAGV